MAYPGAHSRITWFGDAYTGAEIWQTGVRIAGTAVPDTAQMTALATAFATLFNNTALAAPAAVRYLGVKWAPQDVNGTYGPTGEAVEYFLPTPDVGPGGSGYPQIALVLSLRTPFPRGFASNGRMYLPSSTVVAADGRISSANAISVATAGATFVDAVNDVGLGDVAVMSAVGAGRVGLVSATRVGRVMDTQRRRRNQIVEEYTAEVLVPL